MSTGAPHDHQLSTLESKILRLESRVRRLADKSDKREKVVISISTGGGEVLAGVPEARPTASATSHPTIWIEFDETNGKARFMNTFQLSSGFEWRQAFSVDLS